MKRLILLSCLFVLSVLHIHAQDCSVNISGTSCTGSQLTANATSGSALSSLTWYQYTNNVFGADTISSQNNISVVAGNNGTGSGLNQFGFPAGGIAADADGNIYVADAENNRIQKWAPGATSGVTVAGGNGAGSAANQLYRPKDVFVDATGNIYIADENNARIQKWAPGATSGVTVAGGNGVGSSARQFNAPEAVYVDANGNIYVADKYNYRVQRWAPGATRGVTVAGGNGFGTGDNQFNYPVDVYLDAAKNIYVADINTESSDYHRVQKWAPGATSGVTVAGGAGQFGYLLAIYVDADGTLYTTDNGVSGLSPIGVVKKWLPGSGVGVAVAGGHSNGWDVLRYPTGVTFKNGLLYVLDGTYNPRVQKYIPVNGVVDNKFTPTQTGPYTVKAVFKNGCTAESNSTLVRAIPGKPQIYPSDKGNNGNFCYGRTDSFYVSAWDEVTTYAWKIPASCTMLANKNDSVIISVPPGFSKGLLIAKGTNFCGTGISDTMILLGRPLMPFAMFGPRKVFANQTNVVYNVDNDNHEFVSYAWSVPADATITSGQGTTTVIVNWGATAGKISVTATNSCGTSPKKEISVVLKPSGIAAVQNVSNLKFTNNIAQLFPNPAKDNATLTINAKTATKYTIELQDISGKVVMRKDAFLQAGVNNIHLDISKYSAGMYFIRLVTKEEKVSLKLSIAR